MIQVYQDIVQPVVRFSWESSRQHEPSRLFDDASSDFARVGTGAVSSYPFTLACFANLDAAVQAGYIWVGATSGNNWHVLGRDSGGGILAFSRVGSDAAITSNDPPLNVWHHACGVWTNDTLRDAYLNGGNKATNTGESAVGAPARTSLGAFDDDTPGSYMSGQLFWPCIWDVALHLAEIKRLASGVPPWWIRPESIVACPDMKTLYDPFLRDSFVPTGTVISNPYRDWTLPDDTAQFIDTPAAAAAGNPWYQYHQQMAGAA